jgi:hypothetical protein
MRKLLEENENSTEQISNPNPKIEDQWSKIAITKESDRALIELLTRIHDGFNAGRATKQEVASLIIMRFFKNCSETELQEIRSQFFDPILMMEAELRKAKETGILSDAVKEFFQNQFMGSSANQPNAKKTKKNLNADIIKDNVQIQKESA